MRNNNIIIDLELLEHHPFRAYHQTQHLWQCRTPTMLINWSSQLFIKQKLTHCTHCNTHQGSAVIHALI